MYSLFIDTHSSVITVALINDKDTTAAPEFKFTLRGNNKPHLTLRRSKIISQS